MRHRLAAALLLIAPLAAQKTFVINPGAADVLSKAVTAASPGDTLVLRSGIYVATRIQKGITILCDPGVVIDNMFLWSFALSVPAGQHFSMRGGSIRGLAHLAHEFYVGSSQGTVFFDGTSILGAACKVERSRAVTFNNCKLSGLYISACSVSLSDCVIGSSIGSTVWPASLLIDNNPGNTVFLSSTKMDGRSGSRAAIEFKGGRLSVTGGSVVTVPLAAPQPPAIEAKLGTLFVDPSVTLIVPSGPPIAGNATVLKQAVPWMDLVGQTAGSVMSLTMHAEPLGVSYAFLSWPVVPVGPFDDQLWVSVQSPVIFGGPVPASGLLSTQFVIPLSAAGHSFSMQPIAASPAGQLRFGAPRGLIVY